MKISVCVHLNNKTKSLLLVFGHGQASLLVDHCGAGGFLDDFECGTFRKHFAGLSVAERRIFSQFAAADVHGVDLLVQTEFQGLEQGANVA